MHATWHQNQVCPTTARTIHYKKAIFQCHPECWAEPQYFEDIWRKCHTAIQQGCGRSYRGEKEKQETLTIIHHFHLSPVCTLVIMLIMLTSLKAMVYEHSTPEVVGIRHWSVSLSLYCAVYAYIHRKRNGTKRNGTERSGTQRFLTRNGTARQSKTANVLNDNWRSQKRNRTILETFF